MTVKLPISSFLCCCSNGISFALSFVTVVTTPIPVSGFFRLCHSRLRGIVLQLVLGRFVEGLGRIVLLHLIWSILLRSIDIFKMMQMRSNSVVNGLPPRPPRLMSISTVISSLHDEESEPGPGETRPPLPGFKPSLRLYLAFLTLAVITMAVALDGTSLSVALPVSCFRFFQLTVCSHTRYSDNLSEAPWYRH